jgi:uncharacterized protein YndB with AHSA1/START domain
MTAPIHELVLELILDAPKEKLYRGWTEPELMKQWFAPKPWTTSRVEVDHRPGGASLIVMKSPEGQEMPNPGQYLEVIPNRKLVFTDAFVGNWVPKEGAPFMVAEINFEDAGPGKTKYTPRRVTGRLKPRRSTSRWVSFPAGRSARSSKRWPKRSEIKDSLR